jgi:cytochrome oxidase Cu insertion factor (SCO1/SenC/PrrC family)
MSAFISKDISEGQQPRSSGHWMLLLLLIVFATPVLMVIAMHHFDLHPQGSSHGQLIRPARLLLPSSQLINDENINIKPDFLLDKWSMVYIAEDCSEGCLTRLHIMRQLQVSMDKDMGRIQRILLTNSNHIAAIQKQYPDLLILHKPQSAVNNFKQQFEASNSSADNVDEIFLVDPLGNLMLRFPNTLPATELRKDLVRLLAYSWAG